eukprot:3818545-Rhodomonas_salina.1
MWCKQAAEGRSEGNGGRGGGRKQGAVCSHHTRHGTEPRCPLPLASLNTSHGDRAGGKEGGREEEREGGREGGS